MFKYLYINILFAEIIKTTQINAKTWTRKVFFYVINDRCQRNARYMLEW
jgi:hypothetical protein